MAKMTKTRTFGPAYEPNLDRDRILKQHEALRDYFLSHGWGKWRTLEELHEITGYPQASISAQLRHLRKEKFGSFIVLKRRREEQGLWEYQVQHPKPSQEIQGELFGYGNVGL